MKAIVLISGGLDSILAARLVQLQGVSIIPLYFKIPFCHIKKHIFAGTDIRSFVKQSLGVNLKVIDIGMEFMKIILKPDFGFGSNMNPCIDCKILMLKKTKELMPRLNAHFVATGEVLGQRPMSQHKEALRIIEIKSGLKGLLLRPLSAKNLPLTEPEEKGWIRREKLLNFSGRTRKPQIRLAEDFRILNYPNASGGCLLTDKQFSARLKDIVNYGTLDLRNIELLKVGRHFRIGPYAKLIVGRNEKENYKLEEQAAIGDYIFAPEDTVAGPVSLGLGKFSNEDILTSARIACRYSDASQSGLNIICNNLSNENKSFYNVFPIEESILSSMRI